MPKGKRKFFIELTETQELNVGELTRALSRLAGHLDNGRKSLEGGFVTDSNGVRIGTYGWRTQLVTPVESGHGPAKD